MSSNQLGAALTGAQFTGSADTSTNSPRIAGAPISWGVSEVPGWGHQLSPQRVLSEMREIGLAATEFGPDGFLPDEPAARAAFLADHGLQGVGGFVPVVLHDATRDPMPVVEAFMDMCEVVGAEVVVLAAATGLDGYDARPTLDESQWATLLANLDQLHDRATERGMIAGIHPHIGTMVERGDEVDRVLKGSRVGICVDTGHLMAAGADPVALTMEYAHRVRHVHLKDVDGELAARVATGDVSFSHAVSMGLFLPLGMGSVDLAAMVGALQRAGYGGWYVLEQDIKLASAPDGRGPVSDVEASKVYLQGLLSPAPSPNLTLKEEVQ